MKLTNLEWPLIAAALLPWASVAAAALIMPRVSRPDLFFAITVSPSFRQSPPGREILRRYNRAVVMIAVMALLPLVFGHVTTPALVLIPLLGPSAIELAGWFGVFILARHRTAPHHVAPSTEREAELRPRQVSLPGGWAAQAGPFLILAGVCLCLWLRWDSIPARIPNHWGADFKPDGWAAKSPAAVFGNAAVGVLACLLLAGLWHAVVRGVRRIHSTGLRAAREARYIRAISFFLLGMEYWLAVLMGLLGLAALRPNPEAPLRALWLILVAQTVVIGTIFVLAYRAGQGGWRWAAAGEGGETGADAAPVGDRTPDECWKLGVFYFNREDPALFVEKRFGVGWTVNFANPRALLVVGAVLLFILTIIAFIALTADGGASRTP